MADSNDARAQLRERGAALRHQLGLPNNLHDEKLPGLSDLFDELVFGALWDRDGLTRPERLIAVVASLTALERRETLVSYARAAVAAGVSAAGVRETILQAGLYTGFVNAEQCLEAVNEVLGAPVSGNPHDAGPGPDEDLLELGVAVMEDIHGAHARAGYAAGSGTPAALYDLAIRYGYGLLWNRPGLTRRDRLIVSVSVFATLEQHTQLIKFSRSAMAGGLEFTAICEAVMQIAPYCGFPRALNALAALDELSDCTNEVSGHE